MTNQITSAVKLMADFKAVPEKAPVPRQDGYQQQQQQNNCPIKIAQQRHPHGGAL